MTGIYKIENVVNHKVYIGQSINIENRWAAHFESLCANTHYNDYLQRAWNKYGKDKFVFSIIEECSENQLTDREQYWIDYYGGIDSTNTYNNRGASSKGALSEYSKIKISESQKGKPKKPGRTVSPEGRKRLSESHKGICPSKETRNKMSVAQLGKKHTEETKRKIADKNRQKYIDNPKLREEVSNRMKGRIFTEEHRRKLGDVNRGKSYKNNKELIKKHSDGLRNAYLSGRKKAIWITVDGVKKMQNEWANIIGVTPTTLIYYRRKGVGEVEKFIKKHLILLKVDISR